MLDPIYEAIGWLLAQYYALVPNLGIAIILLTFTIMLILYPLTAKQAKSMIAMQKVQPEIKKLQAKYKNDRQKLNEETMKFYQENKINPLASCLPLLAQFPVFISLFQVLRNSYKWVPHGSKLYTDLCGGFGKLCGEDFTHKLADKFPGQLKNLDFGDTLVHHLHFLGIDLQKSATEATGGFLDTAPYFILVLLVIGTSFAQSRQQQKRAPAANKQMAMIMKVVPLIFGVFSLQFPAGLVLYFFVSNLWRLGQQEVIFRRHGSAALPPGGKPGAIDVTSKDRTTTKAPPREEIEATNGGGTGRDEAPPPEEVVPTEPAPARAARTAPATARKAGGGLRGLFSLPPPSEGNGGNASSSAPARQPARTSSSSGPTKPPPQRKRKKKKRKR
jgi:YidC/Oxa1 family membrane protein insertase